MQARGRADRGRQAGLCQHRMRQGMHGGRWQQRRRARRGAEGAMRATGRVRRTGIVCPPPVWPPVGMTQHRTDRSELRDEHSVGPSKCRHRRQHARQNPERRNQRHELPESSVECAARASHARESNGSGHSDNASVAPKLAQGPLGSPRVVLSARSRLRRSWSNLAMPPSIAPSSAVRPCKCSRCYILCCMA